MTKKIVLAYSGGLDTSFCIPYLIENYQAEIHAVLVDCLGMDDEQIQLVDKRAKELGAAHFECVPAFDMLYDRIISNLIKGNVLRDRTYPLSVGAERFIQAEQIAEYARRIGAEAVAHGSTGAGNDQVRFDAALRTLIPGAEIITPIRDKELTRTDTTKYLQSKGFHVEEKTTQYSINDGIWGTTIGGKETTTSDQSLPFDAFPHLKSPSQFTEQAEELTISFHNGLPFAVNGEKMKNKELLQYLLECGRKHGVGRGMHLGDTIIGIKGRIGFEAPVATIVYLAHKELEKLVLTKWQRQLKDQQADMYGMLLHEGHYYDPVMRDIEAFFDSSQQLVKGDSRLYIGHGNLFPLGASSPNSLMNASFAKYGEESTGWTGEEARAFSKLYGLTSKIAHQNKLS
ncbi:MAG: argininosuccinate synthase [Bacteroidetes bacterium]|nr:argininosuccinate synthase [Bacteroidota bacterium]MCH8523719.1 argininosuccinate synthase [Balneolales bacterium]